MGTTTSHRRDTHGLGYQRVDDDHNVAVLIGTMDATARWDATIELRAWERRHLRLVEGERLLDVGCGLGEAALTLAEDLGTTGEVVGIDASSSMLSVASERATGAVCPVRFSVGDDTNWSTLRLDVGDDTITTVVREAMRVERDRPSNAGSRLGGLVLAVQLARAPATIGG